MLIGNYTQHIIVKIEDKQKKTSKWFISLKMIVSSAIQGIMQYPVSNVVFRINAGTVC